MEEQMLSYVAQFGMAGLMGLLWILERRHSSQRERELSEAHTRILEQREELSELIAVVRDNTTAMTSLVQQQTHLTLICEQVAAFFRNTDDPSRAKTSRNASKV